MLHTADWVAKLFSNSAAKVHEICGSFKDVVSFPPPPDLLGEKIPLDHSFGFDMRWLSHYFCTLISCFQTCQVSLLPARHEEKDPKESGKTSGSLNLKQPPMLAKRYGMFETERCSEIR